jgi:hypothetical protein
MTKEKEPRKITRKLGRPFKAPGAAVASPKKNTVAEGADRDPGDRREQHPPRRGGSNRGLSLNILRNAMRGAPAAIAFHNNAVRELLTFAKARAAHTLIKELDGPNARAAAKPPCRYRHLRPRVVLLASRQVR